MSTAAETATEIRSFTVDIPEHQLDELRRRIAATRLPRQELVENASQGVQLATLDTEVEGASHVVMVSQPEVVADVIRDAVAPAGE
jgi:pimeloyl-ACP methyl ester carboxylesterase